MTPTKPVYVGVPVIGSALVLLATGLALVYAPTEALQGEVQRIFYVHAPAGWDMYLACGIVALASVGVLAMPRRAALLDAIAVSAAECGLLFASIMLVTGPIWGRRVWGVWWVWDARLTSTLVLWGVLLAYLVLRGLTPPGSRRARVCAVLGIVGAVDVPVIHFSVNWWRTLHPLATVLRPGRPQLPSSMLLALLVSFAAFTALFVSLLWLRVQLQLADDRLRELEDDLDAPRAPAAVGR
jgi:heme exporter protein C